MPDIRQSIVYFFAINVRTWNRGPLKWWFGWISNKLKIQLLRLKYILTSYFEFDPSTSRSDKKECDIGGFYGFTGIVDDRLIGCYLRPNKSRRSVNLAVGNPATRGCSTSYWTGNNSLPTTVTVVTLGGQFCAATCELNV